MNEVKLAKRIFYAVYKDDGGEAVENLEDEFLRPVDGVLDDLWYDFATRGETRWAKRCAHALKHLTGSN